MGAAEVLMEGIVFGESPRWHDGRLWFSDWGANQVIALGTDGSHQVVATVASFPMCIDFLPDGRLLVVDSAQRRLLRREPDGSLVTHADLSEVSTKPWNDIVVDDRGNAYVNTIGFDFPGGEFAPGLVVLATPEGNVRAGHGQPGPRRLRLRAQPGPGPAPVRRRPELRRARAGEAQRAGHGIPGARAGRREALTSGFGLRSVPRSNSPAGRSVSSGAGW